MKKIFTLISMAFVAMSVNAQETTQVFSVGNGDFNTTDKAQGIQVKVGDKACANVVILSSPYPDDEYQFDSYDATTQKNVYDTTNPIAPWTLQDIENQYLSNIVSDFTKRLDGKGNPFLTDNFEWEYDSDKKRMKLKDCNTTNTVFTAGGDKLPVRGMYIKATPIVDGKLKVGVRIGNGGHPFYVIPVESSSTTFNPLAPTEFTEVKGYFNNNGWNSGADKTPFTLTMPESYIIQDQDVTYTEYAGTPDEKVTTAKPTKQAFLGTIEFNVKSGVTYWIFSPKSQIGFYGFVYAYDQAAFDAADPLPTPEVPTAIEAVKDVQPKADGAIYNLAGQKVDKSFKGIVLKNGKKVVIK